MSAAMRQDEQARLAALKLRTGPRYKQAVLDSKRGSASTLEAFSCAFGMDINPSHTPRLIQLLKRVNIDLRRAAYPIKNLYKRQRPFVIYHTQTCSPDDEALVKNEGSYPSGRSAVGRGFALILAEVNPARADSIMERGRDFGQSRVICDAQWQSDVDAGNELGTMVVARLHSNPAFQTDLAAAKAEVARALRAGAKPAAQCEGTAAIASR
jgi:acid phosphatase (class A)